MRRSFNPKLAVILFVCCGLGVAITFGLHRIQAGRSAGLFLSKARESVEAEDFPEAVRTYRSYLRLRPDSAEARAELGQLLYDLRDYKYAVVELEYALRLTPDNRDARRIAAHSWLLLSQYPDSRAHLDRLMTDEPDAELLCWLGQCQQASLELEEAKTSFQAAIDADPQRLEAYIQLASLSLHGLGQRDEAERVLEQMVQQNSESSRARLIQAKFLQSQSQQWQASGDDEQAQVKSEAAIEAARRAVELDTTNVEALLLVASMELQHQRPEAALEYARLAQQLMPKISEPYLLVAAIDIQSGNSDQAFESLTQGLETVGEQPAEREKLLIGLANYRFDLGQTDEAVEAVDQLRSLRADPTAIRFLEARIEMSNGNWRQASERIESVRRKLREHPMFSRRIDSLLGQCYRELNQPELAITALRRAIAANPTRAIPRLELAILLQRSGRSIASLEELRQLMQLPSAPPVGWLLMSRQSVEATLSQPVESRDWTQASEILDKAEAALPDRAEIPLLRAEVLAARNLHPQADALLKTALEKFKDRESRMMLLIARSKLAQRQQQWEQAESLLDQAEAELGNDIDLRVARLSYLTGRFGDQSLPRLRSLAANTEDLSTTDRSRLLRSIGRAALRLGITELCHEILQRLLSDESVDLQVWLLAHDLAIASDDSEGLSRALDNIKSERGEDASWHYGQAQLVRLRWDQSVTEDQFSEAMEHLAQAEDERPGWAKPLVLKADLMLRWGQVEGAIESLTRAVELGERSPDLVRRNIALLYERARFREAEELLRLLDSLGIGGSNADAPESEAAADATELEWALTAARQIAQDSTNYQDHLWLAQLTNLLSMRGNGRDASPQPAGELRSESERAFRRALELGGSEPQPWIQFVGFLAGYQRNPEAKAAIESAGENITPSTRARCYGLLGELDAAAEAYQQAIDRAPDDQQVLREAIAFDLGNERVASAESRLQGFMELPGVTQRNLIWSRRQLAQLNVTRGGLRNLDEALRLVDENLQSEPSSVPDLRAKAIILASLNNQQSRSQAIDIWNQIFQDANTVTPMDHYRCAQLLEDAGKWIEATSHYRSAIAGANQQRERAAFIAAYVVGLLANEELSDAELWLRQLSEIGSASGAYANLKSELLARRGKHQDSVNLIEQVSASAAEPTGSDSKQLSDQEATRLVRTANQLERLARLATDDERNGYHASAEKMLRRAAEANETSRLALAGFLARIQKTDQALEILEQYEISSDEHQNILSLSEWLARSGKLDRLQLARLRNLLNAWSQELGISPTSLAVQASIQKALGQRESVRRIYRDILRQDSGNLLALNNLAMSLSEEPGGIEEAARLSDKALEIGGRQAALLDTRAVIAIVAGEEELALQLISEATVESQAPIFLLHRAIAYLRLGDQPKALDDLRKLMSADLNADDLGERDRAWFDELQTLGQQLQSQS